MRSIQFRFKSTARGSRVDLQVMISKVPQLGKDLIKSGTATKYLVSEIETGQGIAAAVQNQGPWVTEAALTPAQVAAALGSVNETVAYGAVITRWVPAGGTVSFSGRITVNAGGSSAGTLRCLLQSSVAGTGAWSTFATGSGSYVSPTEPGFDAVSGTFTNTTGTAQLFFFMVTDGRTPSTAGGAVNVASSFLSTA